MSRPANPPFNDSDLRACAFPQREAKMQIVSEAKDKGRSYDPACGSGPGKSGFVQSEKFVESHGGNSQKSAA